MLNELSVIAAGMKAAGLEVPLVHADLKAVRKADRLWVRLDDRGAVAAVGVMTAEQAGRTWTLRDGQQNAFPAVSAAVQKKVGKKWVAVSPLRGPLDPKAVEIVRDGRAPAVDRRAALLTILQNADLDRSLVEGWPRGSYAAKVAARAKLLRSLADGPAASVPAAHDRFLKAVEEPASLFDRLLAAFRDDAGPTGTGELLDLTAAFVLDGTFDAYFDVPTGEFDPLAFDPRNLTAITEALHDAETTRGKVTCRLSGTSAVPVRRSFPQPNLPLIGQSFLHAKNSDAPTRTRYGSDGTAAFPVGRDLAAQLQGAALALTDASRQGRTWSAVSGDVGSDKDLLLAYIAGGEDTRLAELAADDDHPADDDPGIYDWGTAQANAVDATADDEELLTPADFTARAEQVVSALEGDEVQSEDRRLSLTILRSVDTGNSKVVHSELIPIERLREAAASWSAAARNPPPVRVRVWSKKRRAALPGRLWSVAPAALVRLSKMKYINDGEDRRDVVGGPLADALAAFWGPDTARRRAAERWLRLLVRRYASLLVRVGGAGGGLVDLPGSRSKRDEYVAAALKTTAALHVLLARLGRFVPPPSPFASAPPPPDAPEPRTYMTDPAFLLGRLLAAADDLHRGYCFDVRGGSVPPLLMGNALMSTAQVRPASAVASLLRRLRPYHGWAVRKKSDELRDDRPPATRRGKSETAGKPPTAAQKKEATRRAVVGRGMWWAFHLGPLAERLHTELTNERPSDEFKAELLLGYLAGPPRGDGEAKEVPDVPDAENADAGPSA